MSEPTKAKPKFSDELCDLLKAGMERAPESTLKAVADVLRKAAQHGSAPAPAGAPEPE